MTAGIVTPLWMKVIKPYSSSLAAPRGSAAVDEAIVLDMRAAKAAAPSATLNDMEAPRRFWMVVIIGLHNITPATVLPVAIGPTRLCHGLPDPF